MTERVALVTGASGTVGRAVVPGLIEDGFRVAMAGSDEARVGQLAGELGLGQDRWLAAAGDLRQADATRVVLQTVHQRFGRLDAVVHLVGGQAPGGAIAELDPSAVQTMLEQHLWTTFNVARAAVPQMVAAGWGRLITVSSPVATTPIARIAPYAVAKAAQEALMSTIARECARTGVTANVLLARSIRAVGTPPDPSAKDPGTAAEDVAAAIRWLCSDAASSVNGAKIPLYGA